MGSRPRAKRSHKPLSLLERHDRLASRTMQALLTTALLCSLQATPSYGTSLGVESGTLYAQSSTNEIGLHELFRFGGVLGGHPVVFMIDSGATHNFVASAFVSSHKIPVYSRDKPLRVSLADGSTNTIGNQCTLTLEVSNLRSTSDFQVMPMGSLEVILGTPWLREHNPLIHWDTNTSQ